MRIKHTFRLPSELAGRLADYANRKGLPYSAVAEAALASFLSPDNSERMEAAVTRRLDRLIRHVERLEQHIMVSNETLALFVRFWLTSTPSSLEAAQSFVQAKGRERYEAFVEALARRLSSGRRLAQEVGLDVEPRRRSSDEANQA
jgi:hypothetical protein